MHVDEHAFGWAYPVSALLALAVALLLPSAKRSVPPELRTRYAALQLLTLMGAIAGAKLAMLAGDLGWPRQPVSLDSALFSGKSLVGGLLGGFLTAELAKPWFGWREPPNDWFACKLLLSIAIGRVGCLLAGCCRGLPTSSSLSVAYSDAVPRVPIAIFEIAFHGALFGLFWRLHQLGKLRGRLFGLYLTSYGAWRLLSEPLRETPKVLGNFSVYQGLSLLLLLAGLWSLTRRLTLAPEVAAA